MEKYKNFGLLVLTLLFALPAAAQLGEERHNFAVGINGGLNMSSVSFNPKIKLNTLNTMSMGVTMRYMSEKYFKMMCGVQMEINYSQRGWDEKIEDDSGNSYSRTMNYLEIPFMAHLAFGKDALNRGVKVFFTAGRTLLHGIERLLQEFEKRFFRKISPFIHRHTAELSDRYY